MDKEILHKRSNSVSDGKPKLPTADQLKEGEIAINYHKGNETIFIKNDNNEIVTFQNEVVICNGEPTGTTAKIIIDESADDDEIEVYSKAEVDSIIAKLIKLNPTLNWD